MPDSREELIKRLKVEGFSDEQIEKILAALEGKIAIHQIVTRISPSGRGALFRLKRAFYAILSQEKANPKISTEYWKDFASKIIETSSSHDVQDMPCRIKLEYVIKDTPEGKVIKPIAATIEVYDKVKEIRVL